MKFCDIQLRDKHLIESFTKQWESENAEMSFAHIYMWSSNSKIQYAIENEVLYFKLDFPQETIFLWAPVPKNKSISPSEYGEAVRKGFAYLKSIGVEPSFRSVASPFLELIQKGCPELSLHTAPWNFDYVYSSEDLITLKGRKYHGKRGHIKKITNLYPDFEYLPLDNSMAKECMELYDRWREKHFEKTIDQYDERSSVERALLNLEKLNLTGGCIRINGEIKAFTIGEKILSNMCQIHIEKADDDIDGLYPLINQEYASHMCNDVEYINREEDMGLEGLRKAKRSYYPVKMVEKYNATSAGKIICGETEDIVEDSCVLAR